VRILPAIDLLDGQAVRLLQGRYEDVTVYDADPAARARGWRGQVPILHVVDLAGARAGRPTQLDAVSAIAEAFGPGVQVGGGIRTRGDFLAVMQAGATRVVLGSVAVRDPAMVLDLAREHPGVVVIAVDARDGFVAVDGWTQDTRARAIDVVRALGDAPLAGVLYTDVARDGTGVGRTSRRPPSWPPRSPSPSSRRAAWARWTTCDSWPRAGFTSAS
jgi:phosphoribosylformimino-5-aminoimidazole carboxamide ribotide isomerase